MNLANSAAEGETYEAAKQDIQGVDETWARLCNESTLKIDDIRRIQKEVKLLQQLRLTAMDVYNERNLTIPADIAETYIITENLLDINDAQIGMQPTQRETNRVRYGSTAVPLPIIWNEFNIPYRMKKYNYLNTAGRSLMQRKVLEKQGDLIVNGDATMQITIGTTNYIVYGYTTIPGRQTGDITVSWLTNMTTALADVERACEKMQNDNNVDSEAHQVLYLPDSYWLKIGQIAVPTAGTNSFRTQILEQFPQINEIKRLTGLPSDEILLVAHEPEYTQLAVAQEPIVTPNVVNWALAPESFTLHSSMVPIIHTDAAGKTGIVHLSV